ncbi:cytochrome c [Pseudoxanthomonas sp. JBR18]|uniref:c-type cytochrome n=1 Tax=Pseudoxanthomonas sp. JBR18 TaxID=2969308 RepID=UPI002304E7C3|nr:cytochrome c [Pseudoxanthomonas sp. JBR18]WCE03953.1 cytochrome c [Pseudoxanthomonas sp. JBR18]
MRTAVHATRLTLALLAALALGACSKIETTDTAAADPGHASGEHGSASSAGLPPGNIAAGEKLAQQKGKATGQSCVDCHGAEGNAPIAATYPHLAGQYADYLAHALQAYRSGDREQALMSPQAAQLSDQDIANLAAYFASRKSSLRDLHGLD